MRSKILSCLFASVLIICAGCSSKTVSSFESSSVVPTENSAELKVETSESTVNSIAELESATPIQPESVHETIMESTEESEASLEEIPSNGEPSAEQEPDIPAAAKAYVEYEQAKTRDAELYYDEMMLEALKSIDRGFITAKVGTEEFEYAVKLVVPESVYLAYDADDVDGRMDAIYDYCDADPVFAGWFTVDEDSGLLSISIENIENFAQDGIDAGVFVGDQSNFVLNNQIKDLKTFTEILNQNTPGAGVTESVVLAMLSILEDYDGTWENILDDLSFSVG